MSMTATVNDHIRTLQDAMGTGVDGMWGSNTSHEFTKFLEGIQNHLGIAADGWYGDETNAAIREAVENGTMDAEVGNALISLYESGDLNSLHSGRADNLHEEIKAGTYEANETDAAEVSALFTEPQETAALEEAAPPSADIAEETVTVVGTEPFAEEIMPDPQAAADERDFFVRLEERAQGVDWSLNEQTLALQASIYAVENMPIEEALEITQANVDGQYATVFHKVLRAMDMFAEGSVHGQFLDAVLDGSTLDEATAQFGEEARLGYDIEQVLIDQNLLNIGDGTIEIELQGEPDTDLISSAAPLNSRLAFGTAVMTPQEVGGYTPELAFNDDRPILSFAA